MWRGCTCRNRLNIWQAAARSGGPCLFCLESDYFASYWLNYFAAVVLLALLDPSCSIWKKAGSFSSCNQKNLLIPYGLLNLGSAVVSEHGWASGYMHSARYSSAWFSQQSAPVRASFLGGPINLFWPLCFQIVAVSCMVDEICCGCIIHAARAGESTQSGGGVYRRGAVRLSCLGCDSDCTQPNQLREQTQNFRSTCPWCTYTSRGASCSCLRAGFMLPAALSSRWDTDVGIVLYCARWSRCGCAWQV